MSRPQPALVVALGLGQAIAFASSFYLLGVLGGPIGRELGLRPALVSSLLSVALLTSALVGPAVGRRTDRHGARPVLVAAAVGFASGLALLAAAHGPAMLIAGMAVLGAAMAMGLYDTPFALLVSLYGRDARRPMTAVALLGGLGSTLGWPATLALQQAFGWRGACLAWATAQLLVCLPAVLVLVPAVRAQPREAASATAAVRWDRPMIQMAVLFAGAWFVSTCIGAHLPALLGGFGLEPGAAVAAASLVGVAAVGMRLLEFTVLRRLPPLVTTRTATLLHPAGAAALTTLGASAAPVFALGQGAGNGLLTVAKGVLPLSVFGPEGYAYRSALLSTPARFAQAAGPVLYGLLLDRSPALAVAASSGVCLLMFAATFGLDRARRSR